MKTAAWGIPPRGQANFYPAGMEHHSLYPITVASAMDYGTNLVFFRIINDSAKAAPRLNIAEARRLGDLLCSFTHKPVAYEKYRRINL